MGLFAFIPKMPAPTSPAEKEELAMSYAALILHDDGLPITEENLEKILAAANVKVQPFWPRVFAKILDGKDADTINDIIMGGAAAAEEAPKEEAPAEEEEEESDEEAPAEEEEEES